MSDLTVANTILKQLGGNRFKVMTGASNFCGDTNSLSFRLPGDISKKIRYVRVVLTPADLYDVSYLNNKGVALKQNEGIYFDSLQRCFTEATGLDTHL